MTPRLFLIFCVIVFLIEQVLAGFWQKPLFIFPVLAALYSILSPNFSKLMYLIPALIIFGIFSGFFLGFYILAFVISILTTQILKTMIVIRKNSFLIILTLVLVFVFDFFLILMIGTNLQLILIQAKLIHGPKILRPFLLFLLLEQLKNIELN